MSRLHALRDAAGFALPWALGVGLGVGLGAYLTATQGTGAPGASALHAADILVIPAVCAAGAFVVVVAVRLAFVRVSGLVRTSRRDRDDGDREQG